MGKELKKRAPRKLQKKGGGLPTLSLEQVGRAVSTYLAPNGVENVRIPNAALIYGVAAAALFAFAFYHLIVGQGVFAVLLTLLGVVMFAYAVFFIRSTGKSGR